MGILDTPARVSPRWTTLPTGWDGAWRAAKAAQGSTPAQIAMIGDSVTAGQGATDWITNGWVGRVRAGLVSAGNTVTGDFYPAATYGTSLSNQAGTMPYSPLLTAGAVHEAGYGRAYSFATSSSTTFTTPYACTAFDIVYIDLASGTFTYTVDGGSAQTVTTTGSGSLALAKVRKVSVTGLSSAAHTIALGGASATNVFNLVGIATYTAPTSGVQIARSGFPGIRLSDIATSANTTYGAGGVYSYPPDKLQLWQGNTPGGESPTSATGFGFPTQPHLAVVAFGINDVNLGAPISVFRTAMMRLLQALRKGQSNASIIILGSFYPDTRSSDDVIASGRGYDWWRFKSAMRETAAAYNCAWVDIDSKWGPNSYALGVTPAADLHPTDTGHQDIANLLLSII